MTDRMTGSYERVEVITSVQRRRRWTPEQKLAIVEETYQPGMSVSLVARRHGIAPNQLFDWRRLAGQGALTAAGAGEEVVPASEYRNHSPRAAGQAAFASSAAFLEPANHGRAGTRSFARTFERTFITKHDTLLAKAEDHAGRQRSAERGDEIAVTVEHRFGRVNQLPAPIEWLRDNGSCYTARETRRFAADIGLATCTTPVESPQSNGMAEAFVKTLKRDYVRVSPMPDAQTVLRQLPLWLHHYNTEHPHKALGYRSPREFIDLKTR